MSRKLDYIYDLKTLTYFNIFSMHFPGKCNAILMLESISHIVCSGHLSSNNATYACYVANGLHSGACLAGTSWIQVF